MTNKPSKNVAAAAATLIAMVDSGKYSDVRWTWGYIGELLGLTRTQAQQVIYYLRNTDNDHIWTVGTHSSDWEFIPTRDTRDALDGLINQAKHGLTRDLTALHQARTLARIDPDPKYQRFWIRQEVLCERRVADSKAWLSEMTGLS